MDKTTSYDKTVAEDGIGCNAEETSALMRVIDARDNFQTGTEYSYHPKALSKAYRRELVDCLQQWELRFQDNEAGSVEESKRDREKDEYSIELLKFTHTFYHLCE